MTWSMAAETSFIMTMEGSVTSRRLRLQPAQTEVILQCFALMNNPWI